MDKNEFNEELITQFITTINAAKYFNHYISRKFPMVDSELAYIDNQTFTWFLTIPNDWTNEQLQELDEACNSLLEKLYWDKDELIAYSIVKAD